MTDSAENDVPDRCTRCHGDLGWYGLHGVWEPCPDCDPPSDIPPGPCPDTGMPVESCLCMTHDPDGAHFRTTRNLPPDGTNPNNPIIHRPGCSWETTPYCDCGADPERVLPPGGRTLAEIVADSERMADEAEAAHDIPPDDCDCGHNHGVSTTPCDRCYWCQQESRVSWNYRVTRNYISNGDSYFYAIREVYYREDGSIEAWTEDPRDLAGESVKDIKDDLELIQSAFSKPVIDITDEDNPRELT